MRVIKFRGKRVDNGEFVFGSLSNLRKSTRIITQDFNEIFIGIEFDPSTVGQFTGLLDKTEKEIYEGDILGYVPSQKIKKQIGWEAKCACGDMFYDLCGFCLKAKGDNGDTRYIQFPDFIPDELEIIGNIYDNPELLEVT